MILKVSLFLLYYKGYTHADIAFWIQIGRWFYLILRVNTPNE